MMKTFTRPISVYFVYSGLNTRPNIQHSLSPKVMEHYDSYRNEEQNLISCIRFELEANELQ